ncbi:CBS domain-containing protein [Geosporobacter subterraneus DSM 17957]|uniref:CBS domain-containing protein n=1 Tax=Geosporobacter subterraneus DSM 17957 TaxID=1121919 RepID=A0A1M6KZQ3_9FIRM|nr:CBS domain-containing protein [Geosporobacter subterraneus]SHJ64417.1 CBS domain-containing protein [Geosporobacter subterraneus DSM 17957]
MDRVDEFIQIYNELDREIKRVLKLDNGTPHVKALDIMAKKNDLIARNLDVLKQYARLRNCVVHDTVSGIEGPIAVPLPEVVERYQSLLNRFKNPLTVYDICTHRSKMLVASPDSLAIDIMQAMENLLISRVPILEKEKVVGIFNGNVLIQYLASMQKCLISNQTVMKELMEFTSLESHRKEEFDFVDKTLNVYDAENYFRKRNKNNHKLVALFITSDGTRQGKLLGLLTEWDLFNKVDRL